MNMEFNDTRLPDYKPYRVHVPVFFGMEDGITYTFSGKSALTLLLRYFRSVGALRNRADQILVPQWLGAWVYMTMHEHCFPTATFNPLTRGLFVYHQWGFPQDLDPILEFCREHNLFCIEDCAHAFESSYKGKRVGTFGDASIFSLAKFFPCVAGGALYTVNPQLQHFIDAVLPEHNTRLARAVFKRRAVFDAAPSPENRIELTRDYGVYDRTLKIQPNVLAMVRASIAQTPLHNRQTNYQILAREFSKYDFVETLPVDDVMPWIFPLFLDDPFRGKLSSALVSNDIESGVYHFDINRNMLNPDFQKCVAIPCHQGLSQNNISTIIDVVNKAL